MDLNLPNTLTLIRIALVPALVLLLLAQTEATRGFAIIVFCVASATDALDGHFARSRGQVTSFGKLMDPIADKLLITSALVTLVALDRLAWWVPTVILVREFSVTALRMALASRGIVLPAGPLGKVKTVTQIIAVVVLIGFDPNSTWVLALVYLAVATTVVSGLEYFVRLNQHIARSRSSD